MQSKAACACVEDEQDWPEGGWWRTLEDEECPITLEPLSTLPYPPFALYSSHSNIGSNITSFNAAQASYFDGLALASYIVSRGIFQNPLTRTELTRKECRRLDDYLETHWYNHETDGSGNTIGSARASASASAKGDTNPSNHPRDATHVPGLMNADHQRQGRLSVEEAFNLKNSINVRIAGPANNTTTIRAAQHASRGYSHPSEQHLRRIGTLQSTATAALAGLFVYGNNHRNQYRSRYRRSRLGRLGNVDLSAGNQEQRSLEVPEWGFDLDRRLVDSSAYVQEGWTVIDDDEARVVTTEREAYEAVQKAFPRLAAEQDGADSGRHSNGANDSDNSNDVQNRNGSGNSTPRSVHDQQLLDAVRTKSVQEHRKQMERSRQLEAARQHLLQEAVVRRDERKRERQRQREMNSAQHQAIQKETEETAQARAEIEAWRDEQWDKLVLRSTAAGQEERKAGGRHTICLSVTTSNEAKEFQSGTNLSEKRVRDNANGETHGGAGSNGNSNGSKTDSTSRNNDSGGGDDGGNDANHDIDDTDTRTASDAEARKKEKAAAKRKRARERKKLQKREERELAEAKEREMVILAKQTKSKIKCTACGQGMLDCGFEKHGKTFCSPKCARTFAPA